MGVTTGLRHPCNLKKMKNLKESIYDPRVGINVVSTNPALILADLIKDHIERTDGFWQDIAKLADYCDEKK